MNERKTMIRLGGKDREIFADNAALLRFEDAGGDFRQFEGKPIGSVALFIQVNLVSAEDRKELPDKYAIVNAVEDLDSLTSTIEAITTGSTLFSPSGEKKSGVSGGSVTSGQKALSASV